MKHIAVRATFLVTLIPFVLALYVGCSDDKSSETEQSGGTAGTAVSSGQAGSGGLSPMATGGTSVSSNGGVGGLNPEAAGGAGVGGATGGKGGAAGSAGGAGGAVSMGGKGGAAVGGSGGVSAQGACNAGTCTGRCIGSTCGGTWTCEPLAACTSDIASYCGCDGKTFEGSSSCATKSFAYAGTCEAGAICDASKVLCKTLAPQCPTGQVPSVARTCWGPCVPLESCGCTVAADCPLPLQATCHVGKKRCGPFVQ
jgi:hypothetical protein